MSVGLFVNQLRAWFFGAIGTFAPAGVGGSPSNSIFYENPTYVVLRSSPTGAVTALWYIGAHTAQLFYNGVVTEIELNNIGSMILANERMTGYFTIQNFIDAMDRGLLYINESALDYVRNIDLRSIVKLSNGSAWGTYNTATKEIKFDNNLRWKEQIPINYSFEIYYTAVIIHELQHAYDYGSGVILVGEHELGEQSATTKTMLYLKEVRRQLDISEVGANVTVCIVYQWALDYYKANGGTDSQWDDIDN